MYKEPIVALYFNAQDIRINRESRVTKIEEINNTEVNWEKHTK